MKMFDADKTRMIGLPYGKKTMTIVSNSTNSAAILRMEIKHVAAYYFLRTIMKDVDLRGL